MVQPVTVQQAGTWALPPLSSAKGVGYHSALPATVPAAGGSAAAQSAVLPHSSAATTAGGSRRSKKQSEDDFFAGQT